MIKKSLLTAMSAVFICLTTQGMAEVLEQITSTNNGQAGGLSLAAYLDYLQSPEEITTLNLSGYHCQELPDLRKFSNLITLHLNNNSLTKLNAELLPDSIMFLNLNENQFTQTPNLIRLKRLVWLNLRKNHLTALDTTRLPQESISHILINGNPLTTKLPLLGLEHLSSLNLDKDQLAYVDPQQLSRILFLYYDGKQQVIAPQTKRGFWAAFCSSAQVPPVTVD